MPSFQLLRPRRILSAMLLFVLPPAEVRAGDIGTSPPVLSQPGATFSIPDSELPKALSLIVYGDMRFTDPANTQAANPEARRLLASKIAAERPYGILLT